MASYIGRLAAFLITDDVLLAQALAAVGMVEQFLGVRLSPLSPPLPISPSAWLGGIWWEAVAPRR